MTTDVTTLMDSEINALKSRHNGMWVVGILFPVLAVPLALFGNEFGNQYESLRQNHDFAVAEATQLALQPCFEKAASGKEFTFVTPDNPAVLACAQDQAEAQISRAEKTFKMFSFGEGLSKLMLLAGLGVLATIPGQRQKIRTLENTPS